MLIELAELSEDDIMELAGDLNRPYFHAETCVLDAGAVELTIGGVTVAGVFPHWSETQLALAVMEHGDWVRPENFDCEVDGEPWEYTFETPERKAKIYTEEQLEWEAFSALKALELLRMAQKAPDSPSKPLETVSAVVAPEKDSEPSEGPSEPCDGTCCSDEYLSGGSANYYNFKVPFTSPKPCNGPCCENDPDFPARFATIDITGPALVAHLKAVS